MSNTASTLANCRWLSVWCDTFEVSFGHVLFPKNEK